MLILIHLFPGSAVAEQEKEGTTKGMRGNERQHQTKHSVYVSVLFLSFHQMRLVLIIVGLYSLSFFCSFYTNRVELVVCVYLCVCV